MVGKQAGHLSVRDHTGNAFEEQPVTARRRRTDDRTRHGTHWACQPDGMSSGVQRPGPIPGLDHHHALRDRGQQSVVLQEPSISYAAPHGWRYWASSALSGQRCGGVTSTLTMGDDETLQKGTISDEQRKEGGR